MPTLADIAKVAGVGVMSVSRVVNGTRKVSPETEEKVREAIRRIGYQPNEAARILKGHRARVIGLIVPNLADPFFATCANAIQETAREAGYMTLMVASGQQPNVEWQQAELMLQRQIAGLIVVPTGLDNGLYRRAQEQQVPVVALDRPIENLATDTLLVDSREATIHAIQHLQKHGHKEILCLTDEETMYTTSQRLEGYKEAMRRAKLQPRVYNLGPKSGWARDVLPSILASTPKITAIFAVSDLLTIDTLKELRRIKMQVPEQIAIVAFDDFDAASLTTPSITVIAQPVSELGHKAVALLLERIEARNIGTPQRIVLKTTFVVRESCGCGGVEGEVPVKVGKKKKG